LSITKTPNPSSIILQNHLSLIKSTRLALKHVRRFIAGFASVPTFAISRIKTFPFAGDNIGLQQDKYEVASDRELAAFKSKQNDRKQK
jgi:hypothetical protein